MRRRNYSSTSEVRVELYFAILSPQKVGRFSSRQPSWPVTRGNLVLRLVTDEHTNRMYVVVSSTSAASASAFVKKLASDAGVSRSRLIVLSTVKTFAPGSNPLLRFQTLKSNFPEPQNPGKELKVEPAGNTVAERAGKTVQGGNRSTAGWLFRDYPLTQQEVFSDETALYVVSRDGDVTPFDKSRALNALTMIGVQSERSRLIISKLLETARLLSLYVMSSRELVEFFAAELGKIDENLVRKYIGMVNAGRIIYQGAVLTRGDIRRLITAELGSYGLRISRVHLKKLSDDVFEAIQRLSQTSEDNVFIIKASLVSALIRARLDNMPFFRSIRKKGRENVIKSLRKEVLEIAGDAETLLSGVDSEDPRGQLYMEVLRRCVEKLAQAFLLKGGILPSWTLERDVSTILTLRLANPRLREYLRTVVGLFAKGTANPHNLVELVRTARDFSSSLL